MGSPALGPRGGLLDGTVKAECRRAALQESEVTGLHRFVLDDFRDSSTQGLMNEQPWHNMAAHMVAFGFTLKQIAESAGVSINAISGLKAQRWFQERVAQIAHAHGKDIADVIKAEALASVQKLVELRDGAESERVQLAAAVQLLEHGHGKAVQRVVAVTATKHFSSEKEEETALLEELSILQKQRKTLPQENV